MHNAIAHHPLTDARAAMRPSQPTPPYLYTGHDVPWYGIPLWLVRVSCPGYAPSQLLVHLLAGRAWETEKSLSATQQQLNHERVINSILTPNPKHSTVPATKKKINSIPAKTRTREKLKK